MATGEIKKASFFVSWYEVAKTMSPDRALAFYNSIFEYYFYNKEPEEESTIREAFLLIQPNIDKDKKNKCGGAPAGNSNAKKQPRDLCFPLNSFELIKQTDVDDDDDDRCMKKDDDDGGVENKRIPQEFHKNSTILNSIQNFIDSNAITVTNKTYYKIINRLKETGADADFLSFCLEKVKTIYPQSPNLSGAFVSAVLKWDDLVTEYRESKFNETGNNG